jgi:hypothetical protein
VDKLSREQLLDRFQAKAGCMHTQDEAGSVWKRLSLLLDQRQADMLYDGWSHHRDVREGRGDLDEGCSEIRKAWRGEELVMIRICDSCRERG